MQQEPITLTQDRKLRFINAFRVALTSALPNRRHAAASTARRSGIRDLILLPCRCGAPRDSAHLERRSALGSDSRANIGLIKQQSESLSGSAGSTFLSVRKHSNCPPRQNESLFWGASGPFEVLWKAVCGLKRRGLFPGEAPKSRIAQLAFI